MLTGAATWLRGMRRLLGARRSTNALHNVILDTVPDPSEAEMDRYTRYHASNQWGR